MDTIQIDLQSLIGTWRRFGEIGPVYQIIGPGAENKQRSMRIRVLETGEETDYRLADLLSDPHET